MEERGKKKEKEQKNTMNITKGQITMGKEGKLSENLKSRN